MAATTVVGDTDIIEPVIGRATVISFSRRIMTPAVVAVAAWFATRA